MNPTVKVVTCKACGYYLPPEDALKVKEMTTFKAKEYYFHPDHFRCLACQCLLNGKQFYRGPKGEFLCERDSVKANGKEAGFVAQRKEKPDEESCVNCRKSLRGSAFVSLNQKKFHKECFHCSRCKGAFGTKTKFEGKHDVICETCFAEINTATNQPNQPKPNRGTVPAYNNPHANLNEIKAAAAKIEQQHPGQNLHLENVMQFSTVEERFSAKPGQNMTGSSFLNNLREEMLRRKPEEICKACGTKITLESEKVSINGAFFHIKCIAEKKRTTGYQEQPGKFISEKAPMNAAGAPQRLNPNYSFLHQDNNATPVAKHDSPLKNIIPGVHSEIPLLVCYGCQNTVLAGEKYVFVLSHYPFHERCFKCKYCNLNLLINKFYITRDLVTLCLPCSELRNRASLKELTPIKSFDSKTEDSNSKADSIKVDDDEKGPQEICEKCNQAIEGEALKIFGHVLHQECFKCSKCNEVCANEFFYKNNECLCETCYRGQEANVCNACKQPLSKKIYIKDGLFWHPECADTESSNIKPKNTSSFRGSGIRPKVEVITPDQSKLTGNEAARTEEKEEVTTPGFARRRSNEKLTEALDFADIYDKNIQFQGEDNTIKANAQLTFEIKDI